MPGMSVGHLAWSLILVAVFLESGGVQEEPSRGGPPPWAVQDASEGFTKLPGEYFSDARSSQWVLKRFAGEIRGRSGMEEAAVGLPFAMLELLGPGASQSLRRIFADAQGRFEEPNLPEGLYRFKVLFLSFLPIEGEIRISKSAPETALLDLELMPARFLSGDLRGFSLSPSEHIINQVEEELIMPEVRGRVVGNGGPSGWPMAGVLIEIMGPDGSEQLRAAVSDAEGLFQVGELAPGRYRWKATAFGFQSAIGSLLVRPGIEGSKEWEIILYVGV